MLPSPVSLSSTRHHHPYMISSPQKRIKDILLRRTRLTNSAVILLATICMVSLILNIWAYMPSSDVYNVQNLNSQYRGVLSTVSRKPFLQALQHLVIVPCHSIWVGMDSRGRLHEDDWLLEPYQKGGNRIDAFFQHIQKGAELAISDEQALLVFSGGQTRLNSTTTEAESYLRLALSAHVFGISEQSFIRATTENYALDSYQNLLFSILRFREFTRHYPNKITVVGYEFKRARFTDLHRSAIQWPDDRFHYIGVNPSDVDNRNAEEGERQNGYLPYSVDLYGCHTVLLAKRRNRNPYSRFHSYYISSPELASLMDWCPDDNEGSQSSLFTGTLPWNSINSR
ncbi:hypothetical protein BDQ17DRAFT_1365658 [Cyathus striatus]|nr:hypothetical protein BDQ17DRAFT_1365658 [Cyathus striatus]